MNKLGEYVRLARQQLQAFMDDPTARAAYTTIMRKDDCFTIALRENNRQDQIDALAFHLMQIVVPDMVPRADAIAILRQNPTLSTDILDNLMPRESRVTIPVEQSMHVELTNHLRRRIAAHFRGLGEIIDDPKAIVAFVGASDHQKRRRKGLDGFASILDKIGDELLDICSDPEEFQKFHDEMWSFELRHSKDTWTATKVLLDRVLPNPFPRQLALELLAAHDTLCQEEIEESMLRHQVLAAIAQAIASEEQPMLEKFNELYQEEIWSIEHLNDIWPTEEESSTPVL